jgi:hypothetical protein
MTLRITGFVNLINRQWLRLVISKGPNRVGVPSPHLRAATKRCVFQSFRIQDDGRSPETQCKEPLHTHEEQTLPLQIEQAVFAADSLVSISNGTDLRMQTYG